LLHYGHVFAGFAADKVHSVVVIVVRVVVNILHLVPLADLILEREVESGLHLTRIIVTLYCFFRRHAGYCDRSVCLYVRLSHSCIHVSLTLCVICGPIAAVIQSTFKVVIVGACGL